jgi:site-specific recombinase XerD
VKRYERKLRADVQGNRKSPRTVIIYMTGVDQFVTFLATPTDDLATEDMPATVVDITRDHCELFLADLLATRMPATAKSRFQAVKQFLEWLVDEEAIPSNPMRRMQAPSVPLPDDDGLLSPEEIGSMLDTCKGRDFVSVRDNAILRLFSATGVRLAELHGLTYDPDNPNLNPRVTPFLDIEAQVIHVIGKGAKGKAKPRSVRFDDETAIHVDRYLRARAVKLAGKPAPNNALWLTDRGIRQLGMTGVALVVDRAGRASGVGHVHPHQLRHSLADRCLEAGMQEGDVMRLFGWSKRDMLDRYGRSRQTERAHNSYARHNIGAM